MYYSLTEIVQELKKTGCAIIRTNAQDHDIDDFLGEIREAELIDGIVDTNCYVFDGAKYVKDSPDTIEGYRVVRLQEDGTRESVCNLEGIF